jgi:hypothetical protein
MIAIPGRTPPKRDEPQQSATVIIASSDGKLAQGNWGCSVLGWLVAVIIIVVAGAIVWSSSLITSTTRTISSVIENQSSDSPQLENIPEFNGFTLPNIEQAFVAAPRLATAPIQLTGNESAATQMVVTAYQGMARFS